MNEAAPFGTYRPSGAVAAVVAVTRRLPTGWLSRRLTNLLRRIALWRLRGGPADAEALGVRMRLRPANNICDKRMLFAPHTFDPVELRLLAERFRPGFTFIDVGANIGAYSLFVAKRTDGSARILAVEPQPAIFDRLTYNIRLNAFATVKAVACAVADRSGEVTLFLDSKNSGESSVKILGSSASEGVRVPARALLELVREEGYERLDAVKLDVEGAEDLVLEPFLAQAPDALLPGLLILENGRPQWQADLPALLAARGYTPVATTRLNLVFEREPAGTPSNPATPEESHARTE